MRVLLISHTCQSIREGQPKAELLGRHPDIDLTVLVPDRIRMYGKYTYAERPIESSFQFEVGHARLPWAGPARCYLHHYANLARVLEQAKPDVIDLWEEPWGLVAAQVIRLRNRICPEVPIVGETEQNIDRPLPLPFEWMRQYVLNGVQFVVGRSPGAIAVARQRGYTGSSAVVPNAVDDQLFRPMNRGRCRRKLGVSGTTLLYVGRLVPEKGISDLMQAMRQLPSDCRLLIVGEGPMYDQVLRASQTEDRLAGRIKLLPQQPLHTLPEIINAADALVLPSRTTARWKEQFGRVIIEAHACGIPVIGTDSGAIPDVIGQGGIVVCERSPEVLADAVVRLRDRPGESREMGAIGRDRALRLFTWSAVANRMADIYKRVLVQPQPVDQTRSQEIAGDVYNTPTIA